MFEMTMFVADRRINEIMANFDLRPSCKWFVGFKQARFNTAKKISARFFEKIIERSKKDKDFWIPAIEFCGVIYKDKDVKIISDGQYELFLC